MIEFVPVGCVSKAINIVAHLKTSTSSNSALRDICLVPTMCLKSEVSVVRPFYLRQTYENDSHVSVGFIVY